MLNQEQSASNQTMGRASQGETEQPVGQEKIPSIEDIKKIAEDLRAKVEAIKVQREKDIERKLTEDETLIAEAMRNEELLASAQETFEYFDSIQKLGELKDPADVKKLEEIEILVISLKKQRTEIDKRIGVIESSPEILSKLYDAAKQEDVERSMKKELERAYEQFNPQIDQIAQSIKTLAERKNDLWSQRKKQEKEISIVWKKIHDDSFEHAKSILSEKSRFEDVLDKIFRQAQTPQEIQQQLSEAREELGIFKGKEKAAVDFIILRIQKFSEEYDKANSNVSALEQQIEMAKAEETDLCEQFKTVILNSWEAQNKINGLAEKPHSSSDALPINLNYRLKHHMESFADVQRYGEGGKQVGKYRGWDTATQDPKNGYLYNIWKKMTTSAGGFDFIYRNPKETAKERK